MILPNKHIGLSDSLISVGGELLLLLVRPHTVTSLWEKAKRSGSVKTFERFSCALTMLYAFGLVELENGTIRRLT